MEEEKNNLNEQVGKISYKILTSEDILEEKKPEIKEVTKSNEEEIKPEIVEKIIEKPAEEVLPEKLSKVYEDEIKIKDTDNEEERRGLIFSQRISTRKFDESSGTDFKPLKEEPLYQTQLVSQKELFYQPELETQILQPLSTPVLSTEKPLLKQPSPIKKYILITIPIITLVFLTILFKPHKKILSLLIFKEPQKEETTTSTATSVVTFPSQEEPSQIFTLPTTSQIISLPISTATVATTTETITEIIHEPISQPPTSTDKSEEVTSSYPQPQKEFDFLNLFSPREVSIDTLNQNIFNSSFNSFLRKQEEFGTKIYVNFVHNKQKIPYNFIFDYFFKSSKVNFQELKDNFTGNYAFLVLYGYTRKYPIVIFEINNPQKVKKFNENWEKISMANDLKTLFLGLDSVKINNKFISRDYKNYSYRILDLGDNYKIIWSIAKQYLIYSTTETGLKDIMDNL